MQNPLQYLNMNKESFGEEKSNCIRMRKKWGPWSIKLLMYPWSRLKGHNFLSDLPFKDSQLFPLNQFKWTLTPKKSLSFDSDKKINFRKILLCIISFAFHLNKEYTIYTNNKICRQSTKVNIWKYCKDITIYFSFYFLC